MNYRTGLAVLVIGTISSGVSAAGPSWYQLPERPGYLYFADEASLNRSGQTVEVEFLQGGLDSPPGGEHVLLRYRIDCARQKLQMMPGRVFMDDGSEVPDLTLPGGPAEVDIDTVSSGKAFYEFACSEGRRQTRVDDPFRLIRDARAEIYGG